MQSKTIISALRIPSAISIGVITLGGFSTANALELGNYKGTDVSLKGYVKFDAMATSFDEGSLGSGNLGRDFYIPSLTPVGGEDEDVITDFHARQTRFALSTNTKLGEDTIKTYIELDFLVTPDGNERISNSYTSRMRHAFITYNKWLLGQTWTTFMDVGALPETLDFIGNTDGISFGRQAMIRYTNGPWQFAVENPESTITPFGGGGPIVTDDNSMPDFVARYTYKNDNLTLVSALLLRELTYNDTATNIEESTNSYGLSVTGKLKLGSTDDLKFGFVGGSGMGRYFALNIANGAVLDENNELEAIDAYGGFIAYRHFWNDKWRSSITYSANSIDNDTELTGLSVSSSSSSARVNLLYSPHPLLTFGGELALANREIETGDDGNMARLQFSATLKF
ncbi:DcaP family trimeric outer membrane transporter [Marinibactrum halimedae]|uniref:Porin n=1 Tax=Marinibactrum halimedae TaxID=1444977 RepID=A0AA37WML2_9GAMM|nr:DcaP family trimeric outer membrane transporter [Marinibactrum halimedae]MCD9460155.1 DcaP family trimeric outer membrane transporter [Marinibactrum halimedae]GLS26375.1 hypothetical protein GCM10007877_20900 [Marinibactrum halimedae]